MSASLKIDQHVDKIKAAFSQVTVERDRQNCPIFWPARGEAIKFLKFVKEAEGLEYAFMSDLTAYDDQGTEDEAKGRFVVVYQLFSPQEKTRIRVKVRLGESETMPTACGVWDAANWAEREVYDMFGIKFDGHPDLRRILMDIRWEGHPLRKDYYWRKYQLFNDPEPMPEHLLRDDTNTGVTHGTN
jgi:NADH/F420H2 dehydrogenase subunit C